MHKKYPNYLFVSPIHSFSFAYTEVEYEDGLNMCLGLLEDCDEMWLYGDWLNSNGCKEEYKFCTKYKIPVYIWTIKNN